MGGVPQTLAGGRFLIESLAGAGGMGAVYRALDTHTGVVVALKLLSGPVVTDAELRFEREARALSEIRHPGVVRYVAHGRTNDGQPYLAMEWVDGESLEARLSRGTLPLREVITLGIHLAEALAATHALGIVHRDVKPANVILERGAVEQPRLVDFGIAVLPATDRATRTGMIVGTPSYMAPEQAQGASTIEPSADLFSLGCLLYECITGEPAFTGPHLMAVLAKIVLEPLPLLRDRGYRVPAAFDVLLARMTAKSRSARTSDANEVAAALRAIDGVVNETLPGLTMPGNSLTVTEQRLLSIVLARSPSVPFGGVIEADGPTLEAPAGSPLLRALLAIEANGGHAVILKDGTLAVSVRAGGLATDQAALAARCALALHDLSLEFSMAIATERAETAGERAIGEAINRSARLLRECQRVEQSPAIVLDDVTAGLLDLRFDVSTGPVGLRLEGERPVAEAARTLLGRQTAMVGRVRELAALDALYSECLDEPAARVAIVTAPAGIGKSRLRHEITARIAARGDAEIWTVRGDPMREGVSFGLLAQLVRCIARLVIGEPVQAGRQKLAARISRYVPAHDRPRVAEILGELTGVPFPDERSTQLRAARQDRRLLGDQIQRALLDLLDAETAMRPLVIVLEDLHWGDAPSVEVIDAALRRFRDRPVFVLAFARPEIQERFPGLWKDRGLLELRLMPLSKRECERLTRDVLGEQAPPEMLTRLCERSGGNAFFLEELLRLAAEGRAEELPETMRAMIESRILALDVEERRLLRAASVFGATFWRGGVDALLGADAHRGERIAKLTRGEWLVRLPSARLRDEEEYIFQHALVRETAYTMLTATDRTLGHKLAGAWLEAAGETDPAVLAQHFELGAEAMSAVRWYCSAAEQSLEGNNLPEVIGLVKRATALGAAGENLGRLALARALAHNWRGEHAEAEPWAETAMLELPRGQSRWAAAVGERIWVNGNRGNGDEVLRLAKMLFWSEGDAGPMGARAFALSWAVAWLLQVGRHKDLNCIQAEIGAMRSARGDDPVVECAAMNAQMFVTASKGETNAAREAVLRMIGLHERIGDARAGIMSLASLSDLCSRLGAFAEAETAARKSLELSARVGLPFVEALAHLNLGLALMQMGRLGDAKETLARAASDFSRQDDPRLEGWARTYLALTLAREGNFSEAEAEARRSIAVSERFQSVQPAALAALADVLRAQAKVTEALTEATKARRLMEQLGQNEEGASFIRLVYSEALLAAGHHEEARAALSEARVQLLAAAERLHDERWRRSFCDNIPENARTLSLACELLDARINARGDDTKAEG